MRVKGAFGSQQPSSAVESAFQADSKEDIAVSSDSYDFETPTICLP